MGDPLVQGHLVRCVTCAQLANEVTEATDLETPRGSRDPILWTLGDTIRTRHTNLDECCRAGFSDRDICFDWVSMCAGNGRTLDEFHS